MEIVNKFLQDKYQKKRAVIIAVYLIIFFLLCYGIYSWLKPKPSCFDGKQNQNETGVDCGGICGKTCTITAQENLIVRQVGFVESGIASKYDIYGEVSNPNGALGSNKFDYEFRVKNANGNIIAKRSGTNFILPGDKKYITETNVETVDVPANVELDINNVQWVEINDYYERPGLKVINKNYTETSSSVDFSEATGLLKNESPFDFNFVKLNIILKDMSGKIVAINSTRINTVNSGENRDFRVTWPNKFSGSVSNMEVQAEVNVFDSETFFKKYFKPAKFQQLQ